MAKLDAAYMAGFFDGEGSVYAASRYGKTNIGDRRPSPIIMVCIGNTNLPVLELHKAEYGGSLHSRKKNDRWQLQWQWSIGPRAAEQYLRAIRPYLVIKAEVVDAALEYIELQKLPSGERRDYKRMIRKDGRYYSSPTVKPEFREKVIDVWTRIRELNARGAPMNATRRQEVRDRIVNSTAPIQKVFDDGT